MSDKKKKKGFSLGKAIGGIFVTQVDVEGDDEEELTEEELAELEADDTPEAKVSKPKEEKKPEIKVNPDIVNSIKERIDENRLDQYDYMKFMTAIDDQEDMPSEKSLYKFAYSFAKSVGATKDVLMDTADHYMSVITEHEKEFDAKLASEASDKVVKLKNEAETIESTISNKTDQIEQLKAEVDELHNNKKKILDVAKRNEADLTNLQQEGILAYKIFKGQITDGKKKINQYVPDERE